MNKPFLILIAAVIAGGACFAQKTVFTYNPVAVEDEKKSYPYQSYIVTDEQSGKITMILKNRTQAEYFLLGKDFAVEEKFQPADGLANTIFKADWHKYLDGTTNDLGTCFFYSIKDKSLNNGNFHIRMEVADFKSKTVSNKMLFAIPAGEITIDWFTSEGVFYLLTANDKAGHLVFHIVDKSGNVGTKTIPVNFDGLFKQKLSVSEYFSFPQVFNGDEEAELVEGTELTKIYVYPGELIMVVANYNEPPHIWTIDLKKFSITSRRKLDMTGFAGFDGKKEKFYNISCLYKNNLYLLNTSKNKIEIGIFDLASGKLLKKHVIDESSNIPFVETPVEITSRGRASKKNVITSSKELIKELFKGSTGIGLSLNKNDQIILTCGAYDKEERVGGGYYAGSFTQASMPTGAVHAGSNVPVTRTYTTFNSMSNYKSGKAYTYIRTVNFKIVLNSPGFEIINSPAKISNLDKINTLIEKIEDKSQAENVFKLGDSYFVCHYNTANKTFSIQAIE